MRDEFERLIRHYAPMLGLGHWDFTVVERSGGDGCSAEVETWPRVEEFRDQGILPQALYNFLALLGWNPGDEQELMSPEELVKRFSLERVNRKSAVFDPEKLRWLSSRYIQELRRTYGGCQYAKTLEVTAAGRLRAPSFKGLRTDKRPDQCTIDQLAAG